MSSLLVKYDANDTIEFLDNFTDVVYKAKSAGLRRAAKVVKDETISEFKKTKIKYDPNPKYKDTLIEGIRTSGVIDGDTIKVHVMGTSSPGSGTFRLRFFELGTKERYTNTYKGHALKKPRRLGKIKPKRFFETAIGTSEAKASQAFTEAFDKYIERNNN